SGAGVLAINTSGGPGVSATSTSGVGVYATGGAGSGVTGLGGGVVGDTDENSVAGVMGAAKDGAFSVGVYGIYGGRTSSNFFGEVALCGVVGDSIHGPGVAGLSSGPVYGSPGVLALSINDVGLKVGP